MAKIEKENFINEFTDFLKNNIDSNRGEVFTNYQGLTVAEISEIRAKLRLFNCKYTIVKNSLSKIALKKAGLDDLSSFFNGPTAVAIANGDKSDIISAAKFLIDYSKEHNKLKLKAGLLGKKILSEKEVSVLATLPTKEVLISKLLGTMNAPVRNLVYVLNATTKNFVYVIDAVRKQKI